MTGPCDLWKGNSLLLAQTLLVTVTLQLMMLGRGVDYLTLEGNSPRRALTMVETGVPVDMWGAAFVAVALIGLCGLCTRRSRWVVLAHIIAFGLYMALASGQAQMAAEHDWAGIRHATSMLGVAIINLAVGSSYHSRRRARQHVRKETVGNDSP